MAPWLVVYLALAAATRRIEVMASTSAAEGGSAVALQACVGEAGTLVTEVSSAVEARQLADQLVQCPGEIFTVEWKGRVSVEEPLLVSNGTGLKITGVDDAAIDSRRLGEGSTISIVGANLTLERLSLEGATFGVDGGAVAAYDSSSVLLLDCELHSNSASSKGGAIYLQSSSLIAAGANVTANSAGVFGGAVYACDGSTIATRNGTDNIFDSNSAKYGGAFYLEKASIMSLGPGSAEISGNSALFQGGAVYAETDCGVELSGSIVFSDNEAEGSNGGAIVAKNHTLIAASGNTTFSNSVSSRHGGAIFMADNSTIYTTGRTIFLDNRAERDGGAIYAEVHSEVRLSGRTIFDGNAAGELGGSISAHQYVSIFTSGRSKFMDGIASFGGAMFAKKEVVVRLRGETKFHNNTAVNDGGALHFMFGTVSLRGSHKFSENLAKDGAGGALYANNVAELTVAGASFVGNEALWGGAIATFSSGGTPATSSETAITTTTSTTSSSSAGPWRASMSSSSTSVSESPTKVLGCSFNDNRAGEDGGGIYSVAGYDIIRTSNFTDNRAESSGGALLHGGVLAEVSDTVFTRNSAGNEGPAILSLGLLESMTGVTFRDNEFYCEPGKYSSESTVDADSCRFKEVCARCTSECDGTLAAGAIMLDDDKVPVCRPTPEGSQTTKQGGHLEILELLPGYWRSSTKSEDIRECMHEEACRGGVDAREYCSRGYTGPYCAVCVDGFAPGYSHTCKSCLGYSGRSAVAGLVAVAIITLVALGLILASLISKVKPTVRPTASEDAGCSAHEGEHLKGMPESTDGRDSRLSERAMKTLEVWQQRLVKRFPLTAVKIVVVVWQIVTQYSDVAGVNYPGPYEDFLSIIDLVNLDLGFILSFACVYDTTFYDRLLLATLGPFIILGILACTYMLAIRRNRAQREAVAVVRRRHLSVALFVLFVVYGTVSHAVFETFVCDTLDTGESYLRADYSLACSTPRHTAYQVFAALMIVVYPVGIPCIFGWWLMEHRHDLRADPRRHANPILRPAADLWEPYKPERYYYEVVECFRRVALTGFAVFIYPESSAQIAIVLMLSVMFMVVSEILSPFTRPVEMWLYRAGHYVVFASMYLSLLLRVDVSDERSQSQDVFSGVIVIAHAVMLLVVVAQGALVFAGWGDLLEPPVALRGIDTLDDKSTESLEGQSAQHCRSVNPAFGDKRLRDSSSINGQYVSSSDAGDALGRHDADGREQCEKKWEIWERPAPAARSSFFPSPRSSGSSDQLKSAQAPSSLTWAPDQENKQTWRTPLHTRASHAEDVTHPGIEGGRDVNGRFVTGTAEVLHGEAPIVSSNQPDTYQDQPSISESLRAGAHESVKRLVWMREETLGVAGKARARSAPTLPPGPRPLSSPAACASTRSTTQDRRLGFPWQRSTWATDEEKSVDDGTQQQQQQQQQDAPAASAMASAVKSRSFLKAVRVSGRKRQTRNAVGPSPALLSPGHARSRSWISAASGRSVSLRSPSLRSSASARSLSLASYQRENSKRKGLRTFNAKQWTRGDRRRPGGEPLVTGSSAHDLNSGIVHIFEELEDRVKSEKSGSLTHKARRHSPRSPRAPSDTYSTGTATVRGGHNRSLSSGQSSIGMAGVTALFDASDRHYHRGSVVISVDSENSLGTSLSGGCPEPTSPLSRLIARSTFAGALSPHTEEVEKILAHSAGGETGGGSDDGDRSSESGAGVPVGDPEVRLQVPRVMITRKVRSMSPKRSYVANEGNTSGEMAIESCRDGKTVAAALAEPDIRTPSTTTCRNAPPKHCHSDEGMFRDIPGEAAVVGGRRGTTWELLPTLRGPREDSTDDGSNFAVEETTHDVARPRSLPPPLTAKTPAQASTSAETSRQVGYPSFSNQSHVLRVYRATQRRSWASSATHEKRLSPLGGAFESTRSATAASGDATGPHAEAAHRARRLYLKAASGGNEDQARPPTTPESRWLGGSASALRAGDTMVQACRGWRPNGQDCDTREHRDGSSSCLGADTAARDLVPDDLQDSGLPTGVREDDTPGREMRIAAVTRRVGKAGRDEQYHSAGSMDQSRNLPKGAAGAQQRSAGRSGWDKRFPSVSHSRTF